jgi:hypothetical protein
MEILRSATVQCAHCWEQFEILVDCSVSHQEYVEDCSVCCHPVVLEIVCSEEDIVRVETRKENE